MPKDNNTRKYHSFRESIKLLIGIITALAVKNALSQLSLGVVHSNELIRALHEIPSSVWLTFFASITFTLRFFFGNIEYLNSDPDDDTIELLFDSSTILIQSMILALTTNYINNPELFFLYIIGLQVFDIIWWGIFTIQAQIRVKTKPDPSIGFGQVNSFVTIALLLWLGFNYPISVFDHNLSNFFKQVQLNVGYTFGIIIINLCFDLWINGKRYLDNQSLCISQEEDNAN